MIENNGGGTSGFADLALAPELCHVLSDLGYEEPTPIQLAAIPPLVFVLWVIWMKIALGEKL